MTTPKWTPRNTELQEQICYLIGLDYQSCRQVTIKLTIEGLIEVDAQFYAGKYQPTDQKSE